jgi:hypothetical protein
MLKYLFANQEMGLPASSKYPGFVYFRRMCLNGGFGNGKRSG